MADTTAISIVAIVSSAIVGPGVMAWAGRKRDQGRFTHEREMGGERFTHERVMRDTGDLRGLLYEGAEGLEAIQLELAVVEYVSWFNNERLHESLGDVSPAEFEDLYVRQGVQLSNLS